MSVNICKPRADQTRNVTRLSDLKLLLFLVKWENPEGFQLFKDFLSPVFQMELISLATNSKWTAESIQNRMKPICIDNMNGELAF